MESCIYIYMYNSFFVEEKFIHTTYTTYTTYLKKVRLYHNIFCSMVCSMLIDHTTFVNVRLECECMCARVCVWECGNVGWNVCGMGTW